MKATGFEFRFRFWIIVLIYVLGFTAPWNLVWHLDGTGPNAHLWGQLAVALSRGGAMSISAAFNLVLAVGIGCAAVGAGLRIWGSAYLGADVMGDSAMRSDTVVADGPYRYMRNPLYVGSWAFQLALALLMPVSGAVFSTVALIVFHLRLILSEEEFLRGKLGEGYVAYCAMVPRIVPTLRPVTGSGAKGKWGAAVAAEVMMWGVTVSYAVLGWKYDARLLMQCVLVWFGVALVVKGLAGREKA